MSDNSSPLRVLVVDDNRSAADAAAILLGREGHLVEVRHDGASAIARLQEEDFDLVFTDLRMEPVDGLAVVRAARSCDPPVEAIVVTAFGSVDAAVDAMRLGALDFLTKPITADQLLRRVRDFRSAPAAGLALIGDSDFMTLLRSQAVRLAQVRSTVLVTGETGTGRRHLARWLHQNGLDRDAGLVVAQPGRELPAADLAQAGTLLIPLVDDWSLDAHALLLRQLHALDAGQPPRIIATASPAIDSRVAQGDIPPELYFRLAVLVVRLPALRLRPGDIEPLLRYFVALHGRTFGKQPDRPTTRQVRSMEAHRWPGNTRELSNLAERAVVLGGSSFDLMPQSGSGPVADRQRLVEGFNLSSHLEEVERNLLLKAIDETSGDRNAMSRLLGLERNTLRYKLNKYNLLKFT